MLLIKQNSTMLAKPCSEGLAAVAPHPSPGSQPPKQRPIKWEKNSTPSAASCPNTWDKRGQVCLGAWLQPQTRSAPGHLHLVPSAVSKMQESRQKSVYLEQSGMLQVTCLLSIESPKPNKLQVFRMTEQCNGCPVCGGKQQPHRARKLMLLPGVLPPVPA